MLEIRPTCEHCNKQLLPNSADAMICSFECTYCKSCALELFENVCPNCGGGFTERPVRPKGLLSKYPPTNKVTHKPVDLQVFESVLEKNRDIRPVDR